MESSTRGHDQPLADLGDLAHDMDSLGLEGAQVR
jgi:hypothetical protein